MKKSLGRPAKVGIVLTVQPKKTGDLFIGTSCYFRGEQLVVETTKDFNVNYLFFDATNVLYPLQTPLPASRFSKGSKREMWEIKPTTVCGWPGGGISIQVENLSSRKRKFKAFLKGRKLRPGE